MKANERAMLASCINTGISFGWNKAHKHTDNPNEHWIAEQIEDAIWYEIDQYFVFDSDRDVCDEVIEGFDALKEVRCKTHPDAPHGMDRLASHFEGRYVCECESWEPDHALSLSEESYQRGKATLKEKNT